MTMRFQMTREFAAPVEAVWEAWANPELLAKWYSPRDEGCRVEASDFRPGGAYRRVMPGPNGDHVDEGIFHDIAAPTHLVQGTADSLFLIETRLEAIPTGTRMHLRMQGIPPEADDHMKQSWNAGFDKLETLLLG